MALYRVLYKQTEYRNGWVEAESESAARQAFIDAGPECFEDDEYVGDESDAELLDVNIAFDDEVVA